VTLPVVLLHALAIPSGMWAGCRAALATAGHHVIAFDQRGYGGSRLGDAGPSLGVVADDLARELDAGGHEPAVLAGCSMGGCVAMEFARRHPGRLAGLALLSTRAVADAPAVAAARLQFAETILDRTRREALIDRTVPTMLAPGFERQYPAEFKWLRAAVRGVPPTAIAWSQRAMAVRAGALEVLAGVDVPAVVLRGTADGLTSAEEAKQLVDALPRGKLVPIDGAGHLLPLEAPAPVTTALLGLVAETSAVAR
jgi:pimeloyl-ACP methyl ester carboxylesterase